MSKKYLTHNEIKKTIKNSPKPKPKKIISKNSDKNIEKIVTKPIIKPKKKIDKIIELKPDLVLGFSDIQSDICSELIKNGIISIFCISILKICSSCSIN